MPNRIKADSASGLQLISDSSDEIQIQSGSDTVAIVNSSGITMGSGKNLVTTAPAFSATVSSNQTVTSSTYTKVQFPVEDFDTNSNYDNTTNYRFTPTVAGYYQINSNVSINNNNGTAWIMIYKNGSVYNAGSRVLTDASVTANKVSQVAGLVYLNGSTDYVEIYVYHTTSPNTTLNSVPAYCRFSGYLARAV